MPALAALLLVAVLGVFAVLGAHWQRDQAELAEQRYLVGRIEALVDAAFIHRGEHHAWPASYSVLCDAFVDPPQCRRFFSADTDANPLAITETSDGSLLFTLANLPNPALATSVRRGLGAHATIEPDPATNPDANSFSVEFEVALPYRLSLLEATLLSDGSNAMQRPLLFAASQSVGAPCTGQALSVDSDGDLLTCKNSHWAR